MTRNRNRLVLHFWVARWISNQRRPWTRKCLAAEFNVAFPTARDWASAAVRAGIAEPIGKKQHTLFYQTKDVSEHPNQP